MATFAKPENALKRAEELINVGQKQAALQALHDLITSKRYRAWQKTLEKIMFKYVELCVDMRKGRFAKDGLIQYRIVCQQVNVSSLEEVIKYFMQLSTERAEQARSQAEALEEALDVDDLEMDKRPEDLMLSYVSGEKGKDRSDRELVTPWFKFLWETYRTVLEILRNNSKLEALYAMTAHRAFQFCKTYKRTTEFRRLCEIIRNHLANLNKYRDQRDRPDLTAPESLQLYLDTRMEQLKIATELDLWQEAFRSVEDIHGLMSLVKKSPKPSLMVVYYAKLTEIFWVADSHLYHAYAWLKLFTLQKSYNKNLSQKDIQLIAGSVLLAALSVAPYDHKYGASHLELENDKERNLRMAGLINFTLDAKRENREVLSRASLLSELAAKGVMSCVPQEVKDLYNILENESHPLDLASRVQPLLAKIAKLGGKLSTASAVPEVHLAQYTPALEKLTALRVLKQAAQVFQTMKIDMLSKMIPFFDFAVVERISVDAVKYNYVAMKVDHLNGAVIFGNVDIESDTLCDHLAKLTESLNKAWCLIHPPTLKQSKLGDKLYHLSEIVETEHRRLLARKSIIEKRKEEHERQMLEMEREEESKRMKIQKITQEAEKKRLETEYSMRERARIQKEIAEKEMQEAQALLDAQRRKGGKGKKPLIEGELTKQGLIELALSEQLKERQETEKKLQKLAKTMDHLERARRENESPLIEQGWAKRLEEERIRFEQEQLRAIEESQKNHVEDLRRKNRLSRLVEYANAMRQKIDERRQSEFGQVMKEREDRINQQLAMRKMERDRMRKLIYFVTSEEERITQLRQEEETRKREEEERKKIEEAERKARLDAIAEKQRQRERELEEKEKLRRESLLRSTVDPVPRTAPPPAASTESVTAAPAAAAAAASTAPSGGGKYVPKFRRGGSDAAPPERPAAATPDTDRWSRPDDRPPVQSGGDRWQRGSRPVAGGESRLPPSTNSWSSRNRG